MKIPVSRLSPYLAAHAAPMIAALRKNGVEPQFLILSPEWRGHRRRARQQKARSYRLYRATCRREDANR